MDQLGLLSRFHGRDKFRENSIISVIFRRFFFTNLVLFKKTLYLPVVGNDILAYLLPNWSNQLLIHDLISHHPLISMCLSVIYGVRLFSFSYFQSYVSKVLDRKSKKTLHANVLLITLH